MSDTPIMYRPIRTTPSKHGAAEKTPIQPDHLAPRRGRAEAFPESAKADEDTVGPRGRRGHAGT